VTEAKQTFGMLPLDIASKLTGLEYVQGLRDKCAFFRLPPSPRFADIRPTVSGARTNYIRRRPFLPRFLNPMGVNPRRLGIPAVGHHDGLRRPFRPRYRLRVHRTNRPCARTFVKIRGAATKPVRCEGHAACMPAKPRSRPAEARLLDGRRLPYFAHGSQTCLIMRYRQPPAARSVVNPLQPNGTRERASFGRTLLQPTPSSQFFRQWRKQSSIPSDDEKLRVYNSYQPRERHRNIEATL